MLVRPGALGACALIWALAGCATVTRGSSEILVVNSDPSGAEVEISDGQRCRTPCSIELKRKHDYHVIVEKAGYERVETDVRSQIVNAGAAGMAGNVVLGGLIGAGVDAATGATRGLRPNPLELRLVAKALAPAAPAAAGPADVNNSRGGLENVPIEPICDQPLRVDRAVCRGSVRVGMTREAALAALGPADGRSEDGSSLRYGERELVFDRDGKLARIIPPPSN